jgi:hypothetical protein
MYPAWKDTEEMYPTLTERSLRRENMGRDVKKGIRQCRERGTLPRARPKDRYPAWQDTEDTGLGHDGKAEGHGWEKTGKDGKRGLLYPSMPETIIGGMPRASAEKRYPVWEDTEGIYPVMTKANGCEGRV